VLQTVDRGAAKKEEEEEQMKEGLSFISGEQLPFTTGLCHFHHPSVHHRRAALPLLLFLCLETLSTVLQSEHWRVN
jgi:hypothetical protein